MYKALKSFGGVVSMKKGEVKAITDKTVVADLLAAGYIEEAEKPKAKAEGTPKAEEKKPTQKRTKREVK